MEKIGNMGLVIFLLLLLSVQSYAFKQQAKYFGVGKPRNGKYNCDMRVPGWQNIRIWIGPFDTEEQAARACDVAIFYTKGASSVFNLPDSIDYINTFRLPLSLPSNLYLDYPSHRCEIRNFIIRQAKSLVNRIAASTPCVRSWSDVLPAFGTEAEIVEAVDDIHFRKDELDFLFDVLELPDNNRQTLPNILQYVEGEYLQYANDSDAARLDVDPMELECPDAEKAFIGCYINDKEGDYERIRKDVSAFPWETDLHGNARRLDSHGKGEPLPCLECISERIASLLQALQIRDPILWLKDISAPRSHSNGEIVENMIYDNDITEGTHYPACAIHQKVQQNLSLKSQHESLTPEADSTQPANDQTLQRTLKQKIYEYMSSSQLPPELWLTMILGLQLIRASVLEKRKFSQVNLLWDAMANTSFNAWTTDAFLNLKKQRVRDSVTTDGTTQTISGFPEIMSNEWEDTPLSVSDYQIDAASSSMQPILSSLGALSGSDLEAQQKAAMDLYQFSLVPENCTVMRNKRALSILVLRLNDATLQAREYVAAILYKLNRECGILRKHGTQKHLKITARAISDIADLLYQGTPFGRFNAARLLRELARNPENRDHFEHSLAIPILVVSLGNSGPKIRNGCLQTIRILSFSWRHRRCLRACDVFDALLAIIQTGTRKEMEGIRRILNNLVKEPHDDYRAGRIFEIATVRFLYQLCCDLQ